MLKQILKKRYTVNNVSNLQCKIVNCFDIEDQKHLLKCQPIMDRLDKKWSSIDLSYEDIFSKTKKQKTIVQLYIEILDIRNTILEEQTN